MSADRPQRPPPRPSYSDNRREPEREDTPEPASRRDDITLRLANAELERAQWLPRLGTHLATIAQGVEALVALARHERGHHESQGRRDSQVSVHDLAEALAEATGSHHVPPVVDSWPPGLRGWRGPITAGRKLLTLIIAGACAAGGGIAVGYVAHDCGHATTVSPAPK